MESILNDPEFWSIITLTMRMTLTSTLVSAILGVPLGLVLHNARFKGKWLVVNINRTFMAAPPVVIGLVVYLILMRNGPLGFLGLLFSFEAMVIAQTILITPIICGSVYATAQQNATNIQNFAHTMGASRWQTLRLTISELRQGIYFAIILGFGRAVSEVGAIMIVGGNIRHNTRTMTTAIAMLRKQGDFQRGIYFGVILMAIAFLLQIISGIMIKNK